MLVICILPSATFIAVQVGSGRYKLQLMGTLLSVRSTGFVNSGDTDLNTGDQG